MVAALRTHNKSNEITDIDNTTGSAWSDPAYDDAGNTTVAISPLNPATAASDLQLTYDAWNRVVKVTDSAGSPDTLAEYAYDARGFRIARKHFTADVHDATWHDYYTSSWQCIEEREDDLADPPEVRRQYVWGLRYVDDLVQRQRDTRSGPVTHYAVTDRAFNVVALTDTSGNIQQRIVYTPYGTPTFLTSIYQPSTNTYDWRHLFQGLRNDEESGLIENRARMLDPLTGRFLQRDRKGYPDGYNAYAAYHILFGILDPSGLTASRSQAGSLCASLGSGWKVSGTNAPTDESGYNKRLASKKNDVPILHNTNDGSGFDYYQDFYVDLNIDYQWTALPGASTIHINEGESYSGGLSLTYGQIDTSSVSETISKSSTHTVGVEVKTPPIPVLKLIEVKGMYSYSSTKGSSRTESESTSNSSSMTMDLPVNVQPKDNYEFAVIFVGLQAEVSLSSYWPGMSRSGHYDPNGVRNNNVIASGITRVGSIVCERCTYQRPIVNWQDYHDELVPGIVPGGGEVVFPPK